MSFIDLKVIVLVWVSLVCMVRGDVYVDMQVNPATLHNAPLFSNNTPP